MLAQCLNTRHTNKGMGNIVYNIIMKTPIGLRYGTMKLSSVANQVSGTLDLLGHSEPFDGVIDVDGNCTINGRLITLMRTIDYTAVGKISTNAVELMLQGEHNLFKITGIATKESEAET